MDQNNGFKERNDILLKKMKNIFESFHKQREEIIFQNNNYTRWFKEMIIDEDLLGYFENSLPELTGYLYNRMIRDCIRYDCKQDVQYLHVDYIAPISPDDVEFEEWKDLRKERLLKWGSQHSLNRVYIDYNNSELLNLTSLPVVVRDYDLERIHNKFTIDDGNHRFGFAKRNKIPTVMCLVQDKYIIRKSWVENNIDMLKKEKEEDFNEEGTVIL